jgi:lipopolysaccharide biosynthesis glycosyltransferase
MFPPNVSNMLSYLLIDGSKPWTYLASNCYIDVQQKHDAKNYIVIQTKTNWYNMSQKPQSFKMVKANLTLSLP